MAISSVYQVTGSDADLVQTYSDLLSSYTLDLTSQYTDATASINSSLSAAQTSATAALASENAAATSAAASATQATLATTNGAAQVALATTQATLATTNGAAQVALATTQANNAASSASNASASETNASSSATQATSNGAAQVTLAAAQVALATTQAGLATSNGAAQVALATTQANNTASSATAAAASAATATTKATNAATSETNAATSAATATTKAGEAATSATASASSASSASTSATAAQSAQTAAETAETNSETAETNSASSASASASSASSASTSAGTATTQAGIATTKAGEASTSASNAASSASSASSAQTAAESARDATLAAYDNFDDRYLGTKSSAPTVDNDGDALVAGSLYFDSVAGAMYVYTGSAWVAAYVSGTGFLALTGGTMSGDLNFGDNDKAQFGAGNDLLIYHDASESIIEDVGTGDLKVRGSDEVKIQVRNAANTAWLNAVVAADAGAVTLSHNNSAKLATTASGIDVTGTVVADELYIQSTSNDSTVNTIQLAPSTTTNVQGGLGVKSGGIIDVNGVNTVGLQVGGTRYLQASAGGDISFYDNTGVSQGFLWDASTQRLGLGTTTPASALHISSNTYPQLEIDDKASRNYAMGVTASTFRIRDVTGAADRLTIDASGNVGIGTASPLGKFMVKDGTSSPSALVVRQTSEAGAAALSLDSIFNNTNNTDKEVASIKLGVITNGSASPNADIRFETTNSGTLAERMRLTSVGTVGIGTTAPNGNAKFHVVGGRSYFASDSNAFSTYLRYNDSTAGVFVGSPAANEFQVSASSGASRFNIDGDGNIGIRTTAQALDSSLAGLGIASDGTVVQVHNGNGSTLKLSDPATGANRGFAFSLQGTEAVISNCESGSLRFGTGNTERMRIDGSTGNVGIGGVASNQHKLTVYGNLEINNDNADGYIWFHDPNTRSWSVGSDQSTGRFVISSVGGIGSAQKLSLDSSGNLVVDGSITATGGFVGAGGLPPTIQIFTSNGTWTKPTGCKKIKVTVQGGGGGAGGCTSQGGNHVSQGGGAGGAAIEYIDVTSVSSVSVTRGAGGGGGNGSGGTGASGGTSSFGSYCSASGGSGGIPRGGNAGTDNVIQGANCGIGSGGIINIKGTRGGSRQGGIGIFQGGAANLIGNGNGEDGRHGSGGGPASSSGYDSNRRGGAGGAGLVVVEEYY